MGIKLFYLIIVIPCRYLRNVKRQSLLMKDAPAQPAQEVLWWTEYLIRTAGAPHLRSPAAALPWWALCSYINLMLF